MSEKQPAFQFYPGDWQKDPALRRTSKAAKGVWMDTLCLMFECEERGALVLNGKAWSDDDIAWAVGGDIAENLRCLNELLEKGVARRRKDGAVYSDRMVRDEAKRRAAREAGLLGGNPELKDRVKGEVKGESTPPDKRNPTSSSSSSVSSSSSKLNDKDISAAAAAPKVRKPKPINLDSTPFWKEVIDFIGETWKVKKGAPFYWRPQYFKRLKSMIGLYQPWGVMSLWESYLALTDSWAKNAGYSFEMFESKIASLVDDPFWKSGARKFETNLIGAMPPDLAAVLNGAIPNRSSIPRVA